MRLLVHLSGLIVLTLGWRQGGRTRFCTRLCAGEISNVDSKPWLPEGFERDVGAGRKKKPTVPIRVTTLAQLKEHIKEGYRVQDLDVRGDTTAHQGSYAATSCHPVVEALYARRNSNSTPGHRSEGDEMKIALAIEGGGMRGCVAAGMATAVWHLGLDDAIDVVYGSSAGTLVGAYFISKQLPGATDVYYDVLTSAGEEFIDAQSILRSCGLGLFDLRLRSLISLFRDRMGRPVLNLDYLLTTIVQKIKPLDWKLFWSKQKDCVQPLKIVASGLLSRESLVLSAALGNFQNVEELAQCMKASMLLPGVTGEVIRLKGTQALGPNIETTWWKEYPTDSRAEDGEFVRGSQPMCDALVFEPLPYRSAIKDNCTHVLVLRTRADDLSVTVKMSPMEKLIMNRWFGRKLKLQHLVSWMHNQFHKLVYAEDILILNEANRDFGGSKSTKLFCLALPKGIPEVKRLETSRKIIFDSVKLGFAAAYDNLVEDPSKRGQGWNVANEIWPDVLLDSPPVHLKDCARMEGVSQEALGALEGLPNELPIRKRQVLARVLQRLQMLITRS